MNFKPAVLTLAAVTALSAVAAPVLAQDYSGYGGQTYDSDQSYQDDRYDDGAYQDDRYDDRNDQRADSRYDDRAYDQRGGAYDQRGYGDNRYNNGRAYERYNRQGYHSSCRQQRSDRGVAGGVIGALAGAALGSNIADRNVRSEGAVLGAVVGGVVGSQIGRSSACDADGYYYSYNQTSPWRASAGYRGRQDYARRGCRLAVMDRGGYSRQQYVTVCPDRYGRYRVMGY